jgi:cytidylate kinase
MLSFERPKQGSNNRTVKILMQQMDQDGNTYYDNIYQVNIDEMDIRELMVIQSIFMCDSALEIVQLIKLQPNAELFQRSFMELD